MILRAALLLFALIASLAASQEDESPQTGFGGVVYSISATHPIPRATVKYASTDAAGPSGKVKTDASGKYAALDIPPGTYTFVIEAKGYDTREDVDTDVVPGAVTPLDIGLTGPGPPPRGPRSFIAFAIGGVILLVVMTRSQMKNRKLLGRDNDDDKPRRPRRMEHR